MEKYWDKSENILESIRKKSAKKLNKYDFKFLREKKIMNGCGGRNRGIFQKILLKFLTPVFFEASCDLHDFGYWKGGDEERRAECDRKFYEKILEDINNRYCRNSRGDYRESIHINKKTGCTITSCISIYEYFFKKNFYKFLAKIFYIAVRIGGKKYFNYK